MNFIGLLFGVFAAIGSVSAAIADKLPYPGEGDAFLPKRLALVIGVESYGDNGGDVALPPLPDATKDAVAMAKTLPQLGFDDVKLVTRDTMGHQLDKPTLQAAIKDFRDRVKLAGEASGRPPITLFYFSGHGFSTSNGNYLIPSNFFADDLYSFQANALSLMNEVVLKMQTDVQPALQIIITDACRTPVPISIRAQPVTPGSAMITKGPVKPADGSTGKNRTVFFYSTLDGTAAYGNATGGRFTNALIQQLEAAVLGANPTSPLVSMSEIAANASQDMGYDTTSRWQKPSREEDFGAPFYPLPLAETYNRERLIFESMTLPSDVPSNMISRFECDLRSNIRKISEFSYYSKKMIDYMKDIPGLDCSKIPPLGGGLQGAAAPPVRGNNLKWDVPSLAVQPSLPVPSVMPTSSQSQRQGFLKEPSSVWNSLHITDDAGRKERKSSSTLPLEAFAQLNSKPPSPTLADPKPSFGELRSGIEQQGSQEIASQVPNINVPLDQAVVAKSDLFLRSSAGTKFPTTAVIPAGEILQVLGTSSGRTWLLVQHSKLGSGYVSGDLIEPALMTFSKRIGFDPQQSELSDAVKNDLTATFALLGGVAIVDGYVEYPESKGLLELSKAAQLAKFLTNEATQADRSKKSRLFISVRQASPTDDPLPSNTIRLVILGLPLDKQTRTTLAQTYGSGSILKLDPVTLSTGLNESPANTVAADRSNTFGNDPTMGMRICSANGTNCYLSRAPNVAPIEKPVEEAVKRIDKPVVDDRSTGNAENISPGDDKYPGPVGSNIKNLNAQDLGRILGGPNSAVRQVGKLFKF